MSTCEEFEDLLELYHDGELEAETRTAVGRHLRRCDACSAKVKALDRLEHLLHQGDPPVDPDPQYVDRQVSEVLSRLDGGRPALKLWMLAAVASLLVGVIVFIVVQPPRESMEEQVARLVRQYLAAHNGNSEMIAQEISSFGGEAVPVVCRIINEASPEEQVKLSKVITRFGEGERQLVLENLGGPEGEEEIVITAVGWDEEADREVVDNLIDMIRDEAGDDPRFRIFARRAIAEVARWQQNREADDTVRTAVLEWLKSDNAELVRRGAEIADEARIGFTDREIVGLLEAHDESVRKGARKVLMSRYDVDLGEDPAAWKALLDANDR